MSCWVPVKFPERNMAERPLRGDDNEGERAGGAGEGPLGEQRWVPQRSSGGGRSTSGCRGAAGSGRRVGGSPACRRAAQGAGGDGGFQARAQVEARGGHGELGSAPPTPRPGPQHTPRRPRGRLPRCPRAPCRSPQRGGHPEPTSRHRRSLPCRRPSGRRRLSGICSVCTPSTWAWRALSRTAGRLPHESREQGRRSPRGTPEKK